MLWILRLLEGVTGHTGIVAAWLVLPLVAVTCYEVFSRYILGAPTIWAYDVGYMLTGAHFLLAIAFTLREQGHIRIDVFYSRFPKRLQNLIDSLGFAILVLPLGFYLCDSLAQYAVDAYVSGESSGESAWNPIIWPFRLVFFSGFALLVLQTIAELIKNICSLLGLEIKKEQS